MNNKQSIRNAMEIETAGGAVLASHWTTGRGRHIQRRKTPPHCREIAVDQIDQLRGKAATGAKRLIREYPRARKMIVVVDRRALLREARSHSVDV